MACATSIARRLFPIPPGPTRRHHPVARPARAAVGPVPGRAHGRSWSCTRRACGRRRMPTPRHPRAASPGLDSSKRSASSVARSPTTRSASSSAVSKGRYAAVSSRWMRPISSLQPLLAVVASLDVDELRHLGRGEVVLVLESRDLLARRDPAVAVGVDADEHVALRQVRPVELARGMRPRPELEHHRRQAHALDGGAHGRAVRRRARAESNSRTPGSAGRACGSRAVRPRS